MKPFLSSLTYVTVSPCPGSTHPRVAVALSRKKMVLAATAPKM